MRFSTLSLAAVVAALSLPAFADGLMISDPYARAASPTAKAGAAFFVVTNDSDTPDRLIAARTDVAARVELHTHIEDGEGVMRMIEVEDGFEVPAGGEAVLKRGGQHVMMMGLNQSLLQGESIEITLTFENAGDMVLTVPIDNERLDMSGHGDHSGHNHSN